MTPEAGAQKLKEKLYIIIFESDTKAGKAFDIALLWVIIFSVLAVMMESIQEFRKDYGDEFLLVEYSLTGIFTIEYLMRIFCVKNRLRYIFSFYGIIDLLAIIPTYLSVFIPAAQPLIVIRILRLLRVFRVLKLIQFLAEAEVIRLALIASVNKIAVFLFAVVTVLVIVASTIYVIEGPENGFTSIPVSLYWAIVTLTTVGYGDLVPLTFAGRFLANLIMILGYGLIAVPTGIVSVELTQASRPKWKQPKACIKCTHVEHDPDANFCKKCGEKL
ncbi:ion transporter [Cytophagaceae bacterium ABcell3]|nr:ion transporter [Cytophagaceae bacterium ABcell3]